MLEPPAQDFVQGRGLPQAWVKQNAWRVLEPNLSDGLIFLNTWAAWLADVGHPRILHYVAITALAPDPNRLLVAAAPHPGLTPLAQQFASQCFGMLPGFHRLVFEQGHVLLTLCVGDLKAMLREQRFVADSVYLSGADLPCGAPVWDHWAVKALARCCHRGTSMTIDRVPPKLLGTLNHNGFELRPLAVADKWQGHYNPRWEPKAKHTHFSHPSLAPTTCAVIGAGLAGASVAAALARRGWQVQVLDAADTPAAGASGLPVGLMVPHVSADDSPRSRLSRSGMRMTLNQACTLLTQGQDWSGTGVLQRPADGYSPGLPLNWPAEGLDWSRPATSMLTNAAWGAGLPSSTPALWHDKAAWIKPAKLVQAWLAQPGVQFEGGASVASIQREGDGWMLCDATNKILARARLVVVAAAAGSSELLNQLAALTSTPSPTLSPTLTPGLASTVNRVPALHRIAGQMSWAMQRSTDIAALPPFPVNGRGSFTPHVPVNGGSAWFAGATFENSGQALAPSITAQHCANHERLKMLLPASAHALADQFASGSIHAWRNIRCAASDRLPVLGPLVDGAKPTLWISTGLGSRGLSLSVLCAELLAASVGAEPLPIEASLAKFLHSTRSKQPVTLIR